MVIPYVKLEHEGSPDTKVLGSAMEPVITFIDLHHGILHIQDDLLTHCYIIYAILTILNLYTPGIFQSLYEISMLARSTPRSVQWHLSTTLGDVLVVSDKSGPRVLINRKPQQRGRLAVRLVSMRSNVSTVDEG